MVYLSFLLLGQIDTEAQALPFPFSFFIRSLAMVSRVYICITEKFSRLISAQANAIKYKVLFFSVGCSK